MKKLIVDTNAYVRYLSGEEKVLDYFAAADRIYLPVFVLGELFAGFSGGTKERENRRILDQFLSKSSVGLLEATRETAEYFGIIKAALKKAGRPIPLNDIWIAAQALETGSVLATYDPHFLAVPGLRIWDALSEAGR
jgi:tRNA(fMet)-specific endonuclease VapC